MNWIERYVIRAISPGWALRRARARHAFSLYEAAESNRLHRERKDGRSANAQNRRAADTLRKQARHLEQNFDIASGVLDVLVNNTVGPGIAPEPMVLLRDGTPATEFNLQLQKLWDDWIYSPEVTRQLDYYSLQRLVARTEYRDGEAFAQRITGRVAALDHNTKVPYSLEALEPDFIPLDLDEPGRGLVQGVVLNAWGQPTEYRVYKTHPGDEDGRFLNSDTKGIPASRMIHVKLTKRLHQVRGISVFAPVLNRFDDIKEIDESERVAARVAAAMAAYIKKGTPDLYEAADYKIDPATGQPNVPMRHIEWAPGMIFDDLLPGEDIGTIDSSRPNNALIPFRDAQLRSASAGLGASFSSIAKNYDGTYSAQRQELVESYANYRALSRQFVMRWCQPVWDGFVDACLAAGLVNAGGVDMDTVYDASHTLPAMPWIDPQKEVEAARIAEECGYTSRVRIIRSRGDNPTEVTRELEQDKPVKEKLGVGKAAAPAQPAPSPEPDPNDDDAPDASPRRRGSRKRAAAKS